MRLATPNALWLLLLLIPVILSWKRRPRTTRVIGNPFLWQQVAAQSRTSFTARLRRNWIVILQVAFLLAATAALARPVLRFGVRTVAIVVDLSASMGARDGTSTRLAAAAARAISIVESLPSGTQVRVIAARSSPHNVGEYAAGDQALPHAIRALKVTAGPANIPAALDAARAAGDVASADIYVFSDGPPDSGVRWVSVGKPAPNLAITALAARRLPFSPRDGQVLVEASNYGSEPTEAGVELAQNGAVIRRARLRFGARDHATLVADVEGIDGVLSARLVGKDALDVDDTRFAVVPSIEPIRVLLIGGTFFIEKALTANHGLIVDRAASNLRYDVVVCEACRELPPGDAGVLIVPPAANRSTDSAIVTMSAPAHPIADQLDLSGLVAVPIEGAAPNHADVVVARASGQPAVVARESNGRRVVELRLDVGDPRLAVSTAFPILIANAIEWLAAHGENAHELTAGGALHWFLRDKPALPVNIVGPDGASVRASMADQYLTSTATDVAGIYTVRRGSASDVYVVNPATESESDLSAVTVVAHCEPFAAASANALDRQVITPLLLLALGLLAAEWWLRFRGLRRV